MQRTVLRAFIGHLKILVISSLFISAGETLAKTYQLPQIPKLKLGQPTGKVQVLRLIVKTPASTPLQDELYLTGNFPGHCNWEVQCIKLKSIAHRVYGLDIELPSETTSVDYKVTRGAWETQAAHPYGSLHQNQQALLKGAMTTDIYAIPHWLDIEALGIHGAFKQFQLNSPELKKQKLISVWMPSGHETGNARYPVLYIHDGQNVFDYRSASFGQEWSLDETVLAMIERKELPPMIIVSVNSDMDRSSEYTYSMQGKAHAQFLVKTLKPYIDQNYPTKPEREFNYLMGSSHGALISLTVLWEHSKVFSKAAGLSFPAHAQRYEIYRVIEQLGTPAKPIFFYMDHGDQGQDLNYFAPIEEFIRYTNQNFSSQQVALNYQVFPYADHNELDWARRVEIPLKLLFILK